VDECKPLPGGGESPVIPFNDEKNAEREIIHGRWGMLGVTGRGLHSFTSQLNLSRV